MGFQDELKFGSIFWTSIFLDVFNLRDDQFLFYATCNFAKKKNDREVTQ